MTVKLYPHQQTAVDALEDGKILWADVGAGKTITALAYFVSKVCKGTYGDYGSMRTPRDIYVITTAKVRDSRDWEKTAFLFKITNERESSMDGIKITVDSWNNIDKYTEVKDAFFVFDEQRIVGSGAWTKAFIKIAKRNQWILLTATPGDTWLDYIPVFVANGWYKNRTEFKQRHVVYDTYSKFPKVNRYLETGTLVRHRNQVLVHMPFERHTTREVEIVEVDYDVDMFEKVVKKRWHVFENRPLRDVSELFAVMRKVVNSHDSRLEAVRRLSLRHPKLIVFYNFDYELENLRKLYPTSNLESSTSAPWMEAEISTRSNGSRMLSEKSLSSDCGPKNSKSLLNGRKLTISEFSGLVIGPKSESEANTLDDQSKMSSCQNPMSKSNHGPNSRIQQISSKHSSASSSKLGSGTGSITSVVENDSDLSVQGRGSDTGGFRLQSTPKSSTSTRPSSSESSMEVAPPVRIDSAETETFAVAEWNGHRHDPIPETDRWIYLVQYQAGSEGWNCIDTDAMCFYSLTYSYKNWHQAFGRIDRLNTPFSKLFYYVLKSRSPMDKMVWTSLKNKKSFNESSYHGKV